MAKQVAVGRSSFLEYYAVPSEAAYKKAWVTAAPVLVDNCQNLDNLTLTLNVNEDLVILGNTGFSRQLNCFPQTNSKSPNATPRTDDSTLTWFQYALVVANNQVTREIGSANALSTALKRLMLSPRVAPIGHDPRWVTASQYPRVIQV
jgi:hypothetical protein